MSIPLNPFIATSKAPHLRDWKLHQKHFRISIIFSSSHRNLKSFEGRPSKKVQELLQEYPLQPQRCTQLTIEMTGDRNVLNHLYSLGKPESTSILSLPDQTHLSLIQCFEGQRRDLGSNRRLSKEYLPLPILSQVMLFILCDIKVVSWAIAVWGAQPTPEPPLIQLCCRHTKSQGHSPPQPSSSSSFAEDVQNLGEHSRPPPQHPSRFGFATNMYKNACKSTKKTPKTLSSSVNRTEFIAFIILKSSHKLKMEVKNTLWV